MFYKCDNIVSIDFSNFNFSQVKDTSYLMFECYNLTYVNFGNANLSKAEDMSSMFSKCSSLEKVDNCFKTYNVKTINQMFFGCKALKSIDLSNLYTPFLTTMNSAFDTCPKLISIELPNLNISSITSIDGIGNLFHNCRNIKYINLLNYLPGKHMNGDIITIFDQLECDIDNLIICIQTYNITEVTNLVV